MRQPGWRTEDLKPQPLRSGAKPRLGEAKTLQRREHIVGHEGQSQPRRVGPEAPAQHHSSGQVVLNHIVQRFDRTGLLAMLFQQLLGLPGQLFAGRREVFRSLPLQIVCPAACECGWQCSATVQRLLAVLPVGGGQRVCHFSGPRSAGPRTDDGGQWRA